MNTYSSNPLNAISLFIFFVNLSNSNIMCRFVWRKKIERDVVQGRPLDISVKAEKKRQKERMVCIRTLRCQVYNNSALNLSIQKVQTCFL